MLRGYLDNVDRNGIVGWAQDDAAPDQTVSLVVTDNDVRIGGVLANLHRNDLAEAGLGNNCYGFRVTYPEPFSPFERHVIRVRSETDGTDIPPSPITLEPTYSGHLDVVDMKEIIGWVQDQSQPDRPINVIVTDNDELIGCMTANLYRSDLEKEGIGTGRYGFRFSYPHTFSPFQQHLIRVRCESLGSDIPPSPVTLEGLQTFDSSAKAALAGILARYGSHDDTVQKIDFLSQQLERLLQQQADHDSSRAYRERYRHHLQRWKRRLPPADLVLEQASRATNCFRALVVDDRVPQPDRDAGSNAILSHIRCLQRLGYEVTFAPATEFSATHADIEALEDVGIRCCSPPFYGSVEELLCRQSGEFDVAYLHRISNAAKYCQLVRHHFPKARLIYSVADLHHLRFERQAVAEGRPELVAHAARTRRLEFFAAATADAVVTHSAIEAHALKTHVRGVNVHLVRWSTIQRPTAIPFGQRHGIAFIGGFGHAPIRTQHAG